MTAETTTSIRHIDNNTLFQSLDTPYIVFGVDDPDFTILEENAAHAKVAMVDRDETIGRPLFDVFPDTSEGYVETGRSELLESIRKVIRTGKPDQMAEISYSIKDKTGTFEERFWNLTHFPVRGRSGKVIAVYQETKDITKEIRVGAELERTRHQLDQVLASSMIGTFSWDAKKNRVYADDNLLKMFGLEQSKAEDGLSLEDFLASIHPDDRKRVTDEIRRVLKKHQMFEAEYRVCAKDVSTDRWVLARGVIEQADNTTHLSGVVIDISERKKVEEALIKSESEFRFMADSMPQLVWTATPEGKRENFNRRWYEFTGSTPEESEGSKWIELVHPADRKHTWSDWQRSMKNGVVYETEYRLYYAPTQTYRWVIGRGIPYKNPDGTVMKWYGTSTDIDDQKRAARTQAFLGNVSKELSSSLDYKTMLQKVAQICVPAVADWCSVDLYNPEKGFTQVSVAHSDPKKVSVARSFREHNPLHIDNETGVPAVVRTGKTEYYPYIAPEMIEQAIDDDKILKFTKSLQLRSMIVAPIKVQEKVVGGISFVSSDSGRYYTESDLAMMEELAARISLAMTNSRLYEDAQREIRSRQKLERELILEQQKLESRVMERTKQLILTNEGLRDEIIKRQAIEYELQKKTESLEQSNRELEDFAYVASHDLQEPLRKIQAFSDLLITEYQDKLGDGIDYVRRMDTAASRMSTLIQDLLAFSRVSTRKNPTQQVELKGIVEDVIGDLESRIGAVGGSVVVGDLPTVVADPTHMRQLFQNLIGNALKFHKPDKKPKVELFSRIIGSEWEITVKDNGIGFDEKYIDKIFSVFQRLHGRESYEGTGIGLAVCRKIVERYDGSITAVSEKNKGAKFIVRLPRNKERQA